MYLTGMSGYKLPHAPSLTDKCPQRLGDVPAIYNRYVPCLGEGRIDPPPLKRRPLRSDNDHVSVVLDAHGQTVAIQPIGRSQYVAGDSGYLSP